AAVQNVTLRRDAILFRLEDGVLYLATPVAGRTIAAIFVGRGSVELTPPLAIERREVRRSLGDSSVNAGITAAAFVFTDSTLTELGRQVAFRRGGDPGRASGVLGDALDRLLDGPHVLQPTPMTAVMNGESDGFFYAHVQREHGDDLMLVVDPRGGETRSLRVVYHGDLIGFTSVMQDITKWWPGRVRARLPPVLDRWYYVKSSYDWFPRYGGRATDVDLTFHTPQHYRLTSIGRLVDSHTQGDVVTR